MRCRSVKDAAEFKDNAGSGGNTQAKMRKLVFETATRIIARAL